MAEVKKRQKYGLGSAVDKEVVFDFPYLLNEETVSFIRDLGKVMFIMRGPPSTGKATLSEMICQKYPDITFCCADHYFKNTFGAPVRSSQTLKASHLYCKRKAESACKNGIPHILVQNTHMKKWEMQPYLDLAIQYNYTVIMAITLYRFNVTPKALYENSTDGLDIDYFIRRLRQWEDNPAYVTGWFLTPSDSFYTQSVAMEALKKMTGDGKFCRTFDLYDADKAETYFSVRKISCCLAGFSSDSFLMKKYYLGDEVQDAYGKCFEISILGYHVTPTFLNAIVAVDDKMEPLMLKTHQPDTKSESSDVLDTFGSLSLSPNIDKFYKTSPFHVGKTPENCTASTEDWKEGEEIDVSKCSFIHLAEKPTSFTDIKNLKSRFESCLDQAADSNGKIGAASFIELENNLKLCRVGEKEWLVKAEKKVIIKSVFTGFYP